MPTHVVVGSGATGSALAHLLADSGEVVRLVSRRGSGPEHPLVHRVAADATDTHRLAELTRGARTLYQCAMPPYDRWPELFPTLGAAVLTAAERSGADYVMLGNVYAYGPADGPLTEDRPLAPTTAKGRVRAELWQRALDAHTAGRVRVAEVRAADFLGPGALSPFSLLTAGPLLAGAPAAHLGDPTTPHSWTYTGDAARTLRAAADSETWGRAWHVPSTSHAPAAELAAQLARAAGRPLPELPALDRAALAELGRTDPVVAELVEMLYLYDRPALLDATDTERRLSVSATPLRQVLAELTTGC
ncbi:NAD-dependent epimerase/dehydratase family protein [Kitasatospora sp. NPDC001539]|uniref:NAD-dependent epimerase/dehydratase family protein n=1 Tax=Kitasatospora sp. NPDC001539 TaxID=3154384 RepID=UPI00332C3DC5